MRSLWIAEAELESGNRVFANASSGSRLFTVAVAMAAAHRPIEHYYVQPQSYYVSREYSTSVEKIVELTVPRPSIKRVPIDSELCFVLMPFADALRPTYEDVVVPTVVQLGLRCTRADDLFDNRSIMASVWDNIQRARVIIADLTGRNPNVFYEAGIAHALGKEVILIARSMDDVPFDLRHLRCIIYTDTLRGAQSLRENLEKTLRTVLARTALSSIRSTRS